MHERIEYIKSQVGITDVYPQAREHGSSTCPCCNSRGKFHVSNNSYFRCFSSLCELNSYRLGNDCIALYRYLNNLEDKSGFGKALDELEKLHGGVTYQASVSDRSEVLEKVSAIYQYHLFSDRGKPALDYLISRGFDDLFLKIAGVGYAPDSSSLRFFDVDSTSLKDQGLLDDDREYYSNRVIFPIRNIRGELVHFTGRYLGDVPLDSAGKELLPRYKDTKSIGSIKGTKSYLAFGEKINTYPSDVLYLVEGYPDAMSLVQLGFPAVGILGLEKLSSHYSLFSKFKRIVCVFDNDRFKDDHPKYPRQYKSWIRIIPQLIDLQLLLPNLLVEVFKFDSDSGVKDINDWLVKGGTKKDFADVVKASVDIVEYLISNWYFDLTKHLDLVKLVSTTGRGYDQMKRLVPEDIGALDYSLRLFNA
jgi:hypothetical protein